MTPKSIIFVGRSGCGKGTQAELLIEQLKKIDTSGREIFYLETGKKFRDFIEGESYTQKLSKEIYKSGALQPSFIAIHMWSHIFINEFKGDEHMVIDGTPRTYPEAETLDDVFKFYGRENPMVIFLNVGRDWSIARLQERGRADDKSREEIEKRITWFDTDVVPAIEHMRQSRAYDFFEVNGEQSIEKVHEDIMNMLAQKLQ